MSGITYLGVPIRTENDYALAMRHLCKEENQSPRVTRDKGTKLTIRSAIETVMRDGQARTIEEIHGFTKANRSTVSYYVNVMRKDGTLEMVSGGPRLKSKYRMGKGND